jgi:asparagine synthase (glutamine-hydrolysing)
MIAAELGRLGIYLAAARRYLGASPRGRLAMPERVVSLSPPAVEEPWVRQLEDVTRFSLPTLLRYEDRNSMHHSIESRLPFLDHRVLELGLALPYDAKLRSGYGKWIVRALVKDSVPDSIRSARYKRGFDVAGGWLRAGLADHLRTRIMDAAPTLRAFVLPRVELDRTYTSEAIASDAHMLAEAISLVWLSTRA